MAIIGIFSNVGISKSIEAANNNGFQIIPVSFGVSDVAGSLDPSRTTANSGLWYTGTISSRVVVDGHTVKFICTIPTGQIPPNTTRAIREIYINGLDNSLVPFLFIIAQPTPAVTYDPTGSTTLELQASLVNVDLTSIITFAYTQATELTEHNTDPNAHAEMMAALNRAGNFVPVGAGGELFKYRGQPYDEKAEWAGVKASNTYGGLTWTADHTGTDGNSITLTFDGIKTSDAVMQAWNNAHPYNMVSHNGTGTEVLAVGSVTLLGGSLSVASKNVVYRDTDGYYKKALADGTIKSKVAGFADMDAPSKRIVRSSGFIAVDTTGFAIGDDVYLSSTTAGAITSTSTAVKLGIVIANGLILAGGAGGSSGAGADFDAIVTDELGYKKYATTQLAVNAVANNGKILINKLEEVKNTITCGSKTLNFTFNGNATGWKKNPGYQEIQKISFSLVPTSGTFRIEWNAQETVDISFSDNAATVQSAMNALSGHTGVVVTGDYSVGFTITYNGLLSYPLPTFLNAGQNEIQHFAFGAVPDNGSFRFNYNGNYSAYLAFNATAANVQTALEAVTGIGAGNILVTGDFTAGFTVAFQGTLTKLPINQITSANNTLQIGLTPIVITDSTTQQGKRPASNLYSGATQSVITVAELQAGNPVGDTTAITLSADGCSFRGHGLVTDYDIGINFNNTKGHQVELEFASNVRKPLKTDGAVPGVEYSSSGSVGLPEDLESDIRALEHPTNKNRIKITGANLAQLSGLYKTEQFGNLMLDFDGAEIDFSTGTVYKADGVTALGFSFTPASIANGFWNWYSVSLVPDTVGADNRVGAKVIVQSGSSTNATKNLAPRAQFFDGISLCAVSVQGAVAGIQSILQENILQVDYSKYSSKVAHVDIIDINSTSLPTGVSAVIDGHTLANNDTVLFTQSPIAGAYIVSGVGTSIQFDPYPIFNGSNTPSNSDTVKTLLNTTTYLKNFWLYTSAGWKQLDDTGIQSEPTGFFDRTTSTLSFVDGTRTFTITPVGGHFDILQQGKLYRFLTAQSVVIPNAEGTHFIYFNDGVLTSTQTFSSDIIKTFVFTASVYWDATNLTGIMVSDERHGHKMDGDTHRYLHSSIGTRYVSGLSAGNFTTAGTGSANSDAQLSISSGLTFDEDIELSVTDSATPSNPFEQILSTAARIPVYYRSGVNGDWRRYATTVYPLHLGVSRIQYNNPAGPWTTPDATLDGNYVAMWLFATNNQSEPVIAIMGQREDTTLNDAQSNNTYDGLSFGTLPSLEMKVIYRLIFKTDSTYTNVPKAALADVRDLRRAIDVSIGAFVASDHGLLTGLTDADHPASAIYTGATNATPPTYVGGLSTSDTRVSSALSDLDLLFGQLRLKNNSTYPKRVSVTASDKVLNDGSNLIESISNLTMNFTGAQLDFSNGNVYATDGVTVIGTFTNVTPAASQWRYMLISVVAGTVDGTNRYPVTFTVTAAATDGASKSAAVRPSFPTTGTPIGLVAVQEQTGTIKNIDMSDISQLGIGGAGGGSNIFANNAGIKSTSLLAYDANIAALQIFDFADLYGNSSTSAVGMAQNAYYSGGVWKYIANGPASLFEMSAGTLIKYYAVSGLAGGTISWIKVIATDANGNVGFSTTPHTNTSATVRNIELGPNANILFNSAGNDYSLTSNATHNGTNWLYSQVASNPAALLQTTAGIHTFYNAVAGTSGNIVNWTNRFSIGITGGLTGTVDRTSGVNANAVTLTDTVTGVQTAGFGNRILWSSNSGSTSASIGFEAGGDGTNNQSQIALYTQPNVGTGLQRRVTVDYYGNVNFGGAVPHTNEHATTRNFEFGGVNTVISSTSTNVVSWTCNIYYSTAGAYTYASTLAASMITQQAGAIYIYTVASGTAGTTVGLGTQRIHIDINGNVGYWHSTDSNTSLTYKNIHLGTYNDILSSLTTIEGHWLSNAYYNGTNIVYSSTNVASKITQQSGAIKFSTAVSGTGGATVSWTDILTIQTNIQTGVYINGPLSLNGTLSFNSTSIGSISFAGLNSFNYSRTTWWTETLSNAYFDGSNWRSIVANPNSQGAMRVRHDASAGFTIEATGAVTGNQVIISFTPLFGISNQGASIYVTLTPGTDNTYSCGAASFRWTAVYAVNGTIQTSDRRNKMNIESSDLGLDFINSLNPVSYYWKNPANGFNKRNYGLIAQELESILAGREFSGLQYDEENDVYGMKYDQFIAPIIKAIQELSEKIKQLESARLN